MHLKRLKIENFRGLEQIEVVFDTSVSVIIGPNAIGKTTVLEAVRLAKGLLAPRTQSEANQVLISLGALSPHTPQRLLHSALTSRPNAPLSVKCAYELNVGEIRGLRAGAEQFIGTLALRSAGLTFSTPGQVAEFLDSPAGQLALKEARKSLLDEIARLEASKDLNLNLKIDFQTNQVSGEFPTQQLLFSALDGALPPHQSRFSYFPADRALPAGDQPVQLGVSDAGPQLETHNSQPQLKYQRLKNTIFNAIISGTKGRENLEVQFRLIFEKILRGRELGEIGINPLGMLSILIKDVDSGAEFQIDGLSSGEKGLILTFLLISQNVADHGIILLDEPELHLNPAVCRDLLQFLVDEFVEKRGIQAIICSHSAEILAGTFERQGCALYHLRDGKTLAQVRHQDQGEIRDALRRLGSSESEALLYKGTVFVEGLHDKEILQEGFRDLLRRYRVKGRGGRSPIEADIRELQKAEAASEDVGNHYFIFDHDRKPTSLKESSRVRFLQLNRYCLENFLLDADILTDLSRNRAFSDNEKQTTTDMLRAMKELAMAQLDEHVSRQIFQEMGLERFGFDMKAVQQTGPDIVAAALESEMDRMMRLFAELTANGFAADFTNRFKRTKAELETIWDDKWREKCNGKQLLEDLRKNGHFKGDLLRLKKAVVGEMREKSTDTYNSLDKMLHTLLGA